ncbi:hypothetical protein SAY86_005976 [Trapa natans]|uniref:K-box domain-containing protein n=1 Tax=Trapa natans TaxID=22666 RepID=A0AAN7L8V1_TRANT|nr:hypothetical protein SAY86_005976 [Trapa natans]
MGKTLERYQRCSGSSTQPEISLQVDETMQNSYEEYLKLKARVEDLQQTQRNLLGEELGSLDMKDLEQLEHQLENSLKYIRSTKTQSMLDQLADLQKREQLLLHSNESLVKKMEKSSEHLPFQPAWEPAGAQTSHTYGRTAIAQSGDDFFYPLLYNSTSQIGYNPMGSSDHQVSAAATSTSNHNMGGTFSPHWWTFK